MTAGLLTEGTKTRSAEAVDTEVERLGAELDASAGWDGSTVALNVLNSRLDAGLAIMADVALNPAFADAELDRNRTQALDALQVALSQPSSLANLVSARTVFGDSVYGHPASGTPGSLPKITTAELRRFHAASFNPGNAVLILTGKLTADEGFALAQKHFGAWRGGGAGTAAAAVDAARLPAPKTLVIDLPGSDQAAVNVLVPALTRRDPDFVPAQVAASVLGGGYSARLNQEIRIKRGLSYGAFAGLSARERAGLLSASTQTKTASAPEVADLLQAEVAGLASRPVTPAELRARKSTLVGEFGRDLETVDGLAGALAELALHDLPLTELERYAPAVEAVTEAQVRDVAARRLAAGRSSLVVVGDAKTFGAELAAKRPGVVTIPAAELDLDAPTLRKP